MCVVFYRINSPESTNERANQRLACILTAFGVERRLTCTNRSSGTWSGGFSNDDFRASALPYDDAATRTSHKDFVGRLRAAVRCFFLVFRGHLLIQKQDCSDNNSLSCEVFVWLFLFSKNNNRTAGIYLGQNKRPS